MEGECYVRVQPKDLVMDSPFEELVLNSYKMNERLLYFSDDNAKEETVLAFLELQALVSPRDSMPQGLCC